MANQVHEGILLDESVAFTTADLSELGRVEKTVILEMVEYGIIIPEDETRKEWRFSSTALIRFQKALRLHRDLAINWEGISLALDLLEEINDLRQRLKTQSSI